MKRTLFASAFSVLLFFTMPAYSQNEWRMWNTAGLNLSFTKKLDLQVSHLRSYNISNNFTNNFNQTTASLDYDLKKRMSVKVGVMNTGVPASTINKQRYFARFTYRLPVADVITWSNSLQAEIHSANETRFRNRIIYITRVSNKKRFDFLRLNVSAAYWLFYNTGGNAINYYDKDGAVVARNTPNGLHRGRLFLTANSKLTKDLSLSLYYMQQQEFNLLSGNYHQMNVVNPLTGKTARAFDNYNVVGLSLSYDLDLYKKKKSGKSKSNHKNNNHGEEN
ncbi:MAG: DUF2490 domain-containing protein [Lacibacter sp.]